MTGSTPMDEIVIAAVGQVPVGEHWELSLRDLAQRAFESLRSDAGGIPPSLQPEALYVGNMLASQLSDQAHVGALLADHLGLKNIEAATVESGGASGGAALRLGCQALASGQVGVVLVMGVEKFTDRIGPRVESALSTQTDSDFEAVHGLTPNAQAALLMRRYQHEYGVPHSAFEGFPVTAHANAAHNPNAMFRNPIPAEAYEKAGVVSDPMNLFDVAPIADGAAALLLTSRTRIPAGWPHPLVRIAASSLANDRLALHDRLNLLELSAANLSAARACQQAAMSPGEMDFFELHDAYSILAALAFEALGLATPGQGWKLAQDGQIGLEGLAPLATFGGLKARGFPGGATGVYQVVEATLQLRGEAGANQVHGAERGLVQCLGGIAATAVTHILERIPRQ